MGRFGYQGDPRFEPLGAWSYFGYSLLFCIPIVGFILLIVFSFSDSNINRRSYARSFWIPMLIFAVLITIFIVSGAGVMSAMRYRYY